jgi:hypothetical protein
MAKIRMTKLIVAKPSMIKLNMNKIIMEKLTIIKLILAIPTKN